MTAARVVDGYAERARFSHAEITAVRRPRLLRSLLRSARHVAEIPCGAGHFLADYIDTATAVTLVDASPAMLAGAVQRSQAAGLPSERTFAVCGYIDALEPLDDVDLVVVPNAALNQLACHTPLVDVVAAIRQSIRAGVPLLAQVLCAHTEDRVDTSAFYDPTHQHGTWFTDRRFDPTKAGGAAARRRRQHRHGDRVRLDFAYVDAAGVPLHEATVDLRLVTGAQLERALSTAGFGHVRFLPGHGGLSEVLADAETRP